MAEKLTAAQAVEEALAEEDAHVFDYVDPHRFMWLLEKRGHHIIAPEDPETIERAAKALCDAYWSGRPKIWGDDRGVQDIWRALAQTTLTAAVSPDEERQDDFITCIATKG